HTARRSCASTSRAPEASRPAGVTPRRQHGGVGYRGKVHEQARARALRAQAWTLGEIAAELGVSRSSVSLWVRDVPFDESVRAARARDNRGVAARRRGPNALARRKQDEIARLLAEGR